MREVTATQHCKTCKSPLYHYSLSGYCHTHAAAARPCVMAHEGCTGRVASWSRSGVCRRHASGLKNGMRGMDDAASDR